MLTIRRIYLGRVKYGVLELMLRKDLRADAYVELSIVAKDCFQWYSKL